MLDWPYTRRHTLGYYNVKSKNQNTLIPATWQRSHAPNKTPCRKIATRPLLLNLLLFELGTYTISATQYTAIQAKNSSKFKTFLTSFLNPKICNYATDQVIRNQKITWIIEDIRNNNAKNNYQT